MKLVRKWESFFNDKLEESKLLVIYRFISFFVTSYFYVLNNVGHGSSRKIIIICCLLVASLILSYLYTTFEKSPKIIKILIVIEIIGNTLLLVPSGGIKSPFIWYSLNPILISSIFLKKRYGWINFLIYLLCYGIILKYFTNTNVEILKLFKDESNLLLSFIMIIAAIQVLAVSINNTKKESNRVVKANIQLEMANNMVIESIDHIKALYQSVNILTNQGNREGIINVSFDHIKRITKANIVFYYDITNNSNKMIFSGNNFLLTSIEEHILKSMNEILECKNPLEIGISNSKFIIVPVSSSYATYGVLGMEANSNKESIVYSNNAYQLQFLSEMISNAFERLSLEEISQRLLVTEEQNRIANEIHDSVLQRLFSMSCGIFSLTKNSNNYTNDELTYKLNDFREIIDLTMKDLREKIYGLSWKKYGNSSFNQDVKRYIDDIKKMNQVSIPFSIIGNMEIISIKQKKALYRMICEGIGNAVRHGLAKNIEVKLNILPEFTSLSIIDDGIGFDLNMPIEDSTKGIGMQNLNQLAEILHGDINIESELNCGTKIEIMIPNAMKGEVAV